MGPINHELKPPKLRPKQTFPVYELINPGSSYNDGKLTSSYVILQFLASRVAKPDIEINIVSLVPVSCKQV
jgi:hypothetical protein